MAVAGTVRLLSERLGVSEEVAATIAGTGASALGWVGSFLTSYLASKAAESKAVAPETDDDLLRNGDWIHLSALAVAEQLRKAVEENELPGISDEELLALADKVESDWAKLHDTAGFRDWLDGIDRSTAIAWFGAAARSESPQALDVETWKGLLRPLTIKHGELRNDNATDADGAALDRVAAYLRDKHPQAVYRLLKHEEGERAFKGLQLTMLGEIHHNLCDTLVQRTEQLEAATNAIRADIEKLGPRIQELILELTPAAAQTIERDWLESQFAEHVEMWTNLCEQSVLLYRNQDAIRANQRTTHAKLDEVGSKVDALNETVESLKQQITATRSDDVSTNATTGRRRISNLHRQMFVERLYVERKTPLKKLRQLLLKEKKTAVKQAVGIHGLGGIGKTQLALEYARKFEDEYDLIWWLRAEDSTTLLVDLVELAVPLGLLEAGQVVEDQNAIANAVLDTVSSDEWSGRWLLIYDNVESKDVLKGRRPAGDGHTIFTSRDPDWASIAAPLQVAVMTQTESRKLIKERSGQTDMKAADEIAGRLGKLPLALEVAAAYCAATSSPLADYVSLLDEVGLELLDESQPVDYATIVSRAWQPSFQKAIDECEQAGVLLGILSHVAPDDFPEELVTDELGGKKELNAAIRALARYSLISRTAAKDQEFKGYLSVHRLVQEVYRDSLSAEAADQLTESALRVINGAFPAESQDVTTWPVCDVLLPHANAILSHADDHKDRGENNPLSRLINQMGLYHLGRANHATAEPLMRRALAIDEQSFGENHPNVAIDLNNLALLLQATNRLSEAEPLMRRALAIGEQSFGENHPDVAIRLNNLATLLQATNRLSEAEPLMRRALAIDEQSFGEYHPRVAVQLNNLARLLQETNRLSEAEPLMRRALAIDEQSFGENHPKVAIRLNNLALLLRETNRLSEAEPLMRRALAIDEQSFGENHPNVARDLNNLALLLQETNRLSEAEPLMRRALAIDEQSFGENHPDVAIDLNNLALLLKATNRLSEAEPLMRRALAIDEQSFGENHPNVARDLNSLAQLLKATNRLSEAEPLMRRALAIDEQSFGENHPKVAIDLNNLALLLQATNRLSEAEPLMRRAVGIFYASLGEEHPNTQTVSRNYELLLKEMGLSDEEIAERVRTASTVDAKNA